MGPSGLGNRSLHSEEVVLESDRPFVPFVEGSGQVLEHQDVLLEGMGKVSQKYSITALFFANLDLVMSILNFATCSLIEEFPIFISFIL